MDDIGEQISLEAFSFVKKNAKIIIAKFANLNEHPPSPKPFTIFMAGSPGAGKTEFSKSFNPDLFKYSVDQKTKIVRIDADEVRNLVPQFNGHNSSFVQRAASKGVSILFDHTHHYGQNVILDGTFANYKISSENIKVAIKKNRSVGIFYLYQDPKIAWEFTKIREKVENRDISKTVFLESFFAAKDNVNEAKKVFGNKVKLNLIIKNFENKDVKYHIDIERVDFYLKNKYTKEQLNNELK